MVYSRHPPRADVRADPVRWPMSSLFSFQRAALVRDKAPVKGEREARLLKASAASASIPSVACDETRRGAWAAVGPVAQVVRAHA